MKSGKTPLIDAVVCCRWWWPLFLPPSVPSFSTAGFCPLVCLMHKHHHSCEPGPLATLLNYLTWCLPSLWEPPVPQKRGGSVSATLAAWVGRLKVAMVWVGHEAEGNGAFPGLLAREILCVLPSSGSCCCYCTTKTVGTFPWAKVCPESPRQLRLRFSSAHLCSLWFLRSSCCAGADVGAASAVAVFWLPPFPWLQLPPFQQGWVYAGCAHGVCMRHTWLFVGSGDALVGLLQILVCLSLKLSLVNLGEVLSPLTLVLHPFPAGTVLQQCSSRKT